MKKLLFGLVLALVHNVVSATEITGIGKVGEIWSGYNEGNILFKLSIPHINPANCGSSGFYVVDATKADADKFLSVLLAAQSRKADVQVRISKTLCASGYPVALRMAIKP